jgi:short-subunit dehydrogenase involved in D-alanine esterification of teichoic acids
LLRTLRVSFKNYHAINPSAIRLTSSLIEHLKEKSDAVVAYTSAVLGFVPLAATAVYSSTKATLHSYILSQRFMLRDTTVRVLEIAPPWVRTELMSSQEAKQAMPVAFLGADLGDVDVEVADRIDLEFALVGLVAIDLRQARDAVALQAAMQR